MKKDECQDYYLLKYGTMDQKRICKHHAGKSFIFCENLIKSGECEHGCTE